MKKLIAPALTALFCLATVAFAADVANYMAPGGSAWHIGGSLAVDPGGVITVDKGAATANSGDSYAVTINKMGGVVTTDALTTAAGSSLSITVADSQVSPSSLVLVSRTGGTSTGGTPVLKAVPGAGTLTLTLDNKDATAAFNGTFVVSYLVE